MLFKKKELNRIVDILGIKDGSRVADIGAGLGGFAVAFGRRVGNSGVVMAVEPGERLLTLINWRARRAGLKNVRTLALEEDLPPLEKDSLDAVFIRHVYHHIPNTKEVNAVLYGALKKDGKCLVIDFPPIWYLTLLNPVKDVPENRGGHGIPKRILIEEMTSAGFNLVREIDPWKWGGRYALVFEK